MILTTEKFEAARSYWLEKLSGELDIVRLAADFPVPPGPLPYEAGTCDVAFDQEIGERLLQVSKNNDLSLYVILLTAFKILLYKYTAQEDLVVAAPTLVQSDQNYNKYIALRDLLLPGLSFKQLLLEVNRTALEGYRHQYYPMRRLMDFLEVPDSTLFFNVLLALENIHGGEFLREAVEIYGNQLTLSVVKTNGRLRGSVIFNTRRFARESIQQMQSYFLGVLRQILRDTGIAISDIRLMTEEERRRLLVEFNDTQREYPGYPEAGKLTLHELFEAQAQQTPEHPAIFWKGESLTYRQLDEQANRVARYLSGVIGLRPEDLVGILAEASPHLVIAILGVLKAGCAYVPMAPGLPEERLKHMIDDTATPVLLSQKKYLRTLNRLQWDCQSLETIVVLDSRQIQAEVEPERSELMDEKLWDYIGEAASDEITGGGWYTSDTGDAFTREEMEEYGNNVLEKVSPFLHPEARVLEIGCASGISMYRIAPRVGYYHGTDLSRVIIANNQKRVKTANHTNIRLSCLKAHEIDTLKEGNYDMVIMNSVIQCFPGHNYFKDVIRKAIDLLAETGCIFIGDIMDLDLKEALIRELREFKQAHPDEGYTTKHDFSPELFLSRAFLEDLKTRFPQIADIDYSYKIHTLANELTKYRFDALIRVEKNREQTGTPGVPRKRQHDLSHLEAHCGDPAAGPVAPAVTSRNSAYLIYTSGSTGIPKGALLDHQGVVNMLLYRKQAYQLDSRCVTLQLFSYAFDGFITSFFTPVISGAAVAMPGEEEIKDLKRLARAIVQHRVTHFICVPSFFQLIIEHLTPSEAMGLKVVTLAGERVTPQVLEAARKKSNTLEIANEYGVTEAAVMSTLFRHQEDHPTVTIGHPIGNTEIYILDPHHTPQPPGIPGEICLAGLGLARGYLNNPGLTREKFVSSPLSRSGRLYKTGDRGRWTAAGNIELAGRMDQQVKIRGFRIEPGEIENRLLNHQDITQAAVMARINKTGDHLLCAYFVSRLPLETPDLKEYLARVLPDYMIPAYFVRLDRMPVTLGGKINRPALPEVELKGGENYTAPRDEYDEKMVALWAEVLGIEKEIIGIDDNFFDFGGHSLKAVILVARVHKELNVKLPLADVFATPTIRELSELLRGSSQEHFTAIAAVEAREWYPLSSAQKRLYVMYQLDTASLVYNMPMVFPLPFAPGGGKLETLFKQLILRHETLRTSVEILDDVPVQRVHPSVAFELEYYGEAPLPSLDVTALIDRFVRPFDLARAPLLRAGLITTADSGQLLVTDMHHILCDGASLKRLQQDFQALFLGEPLPPLRLQYNDYVLWQYRHREKDLLARQETYWLNRLAGEIPLLELPYDYPRPSLQQFAGNTLEFEIGPEETAALKKIALEENATLFMVTLTVTVVLFYSSSGQEDILLGTPTAGRRHADLEHIIGMFVNTLVIRNYPTASKTFRQLLAEVRQTTLEAFENQDYQFEDLVERVVKTRDKSRNPLFDVMFSLLAADPPKAPAIAGSTARTGNTSADTAKGQQGGYGYESRVSAFDMFWNGALTEDRLIFVLEYCTALFKEETIRRFIRYFHEILAAVITDRDLPLEELRISHDLFDTASANPPLTFDF